jgi:hypothetical protein
MPSHPVHGMLRNLNSQGRLTDGDPAGDVEELGYVQRALSCTAEEGILRLSFLGGVSESHFCVFLYMDDVVG